MCEHDPHRRREDVSAPGVEPEQARPPAPLVVHHRGVICIIGEDVHVQDDRYRQVRPDPDTLELDAAIAQPRLRRAAEERPVLVTQDCGDLDAGVAREEDVDVMLNLRMDEEWPWVEVLQAVDGDCAGVEHGLDAWQGAEDEAVDLLAELVGEGEEGCWRRRLTYWWRGGLHCGDVLGPACVVESLAFLRQ